MSGGGIAVLVIVVLVVVGFILWKYGDHKNLQAMTPEERANELARRDAQRVEANALSQHGDRNAALRPDLVV